MEQYKPNKTDLVDEMKRQFRLFIEGCNSLTQTQKQDIIGELDSYWHARRFSGSPFEYGAIEFSVQKWRELNLGFAELWKNVAINNASHSNEPHEVANKTLEAFKDQFKLSNETN